MKNNVKFHMYINQAPCGDASIYKINNDDSTSINRIKNKTKGKRKFESLHEENPKKIQKNLETSEIDPSKINKLTEDIQRTGAKVVHSSPIQDSKKEGDPYHIFKVLRTKPGRVSIL